MFWEKNYSDSSVFKDEKFIEEMFGKEIEPNYNKIIREISSETPEVSFEIRERLVQWIFYTKMRSPIWEPSTFTESKASRYSQQLHLENFIDESRFITALEFFVQDVCSKCWTIYKNPINAYWWTSDNPGYCINLERAEAGEQVIPDPYCRLGGANSVLFYPLSKNYCLNIHGYQSGEDSKLNLTNTNITFEQADESLCKVINFYTLISQARLVISADRESLRKVEEIKTKSH